MVEMIEKVRYGLLFLRTPMDAFGLNEQKIRASGLIPSDCPSYFLELGTKTKSYGKHLLYEIGNRLNV
jgi:hypothetical protein